MMDSNVTTKELRKEIREIGFTIILAEAKEHFANFIVYDIYGYDGKTNNCLYQTEDDDTTEDLFLAKPYLEFTIKWDSCSHLYYCNDGYLHFCGVRDYKRNIKLLKMLYELGFEAMGKKPKEGEEW